MYDLHLSTACTSFRLRPCCDSVETSILFSSYQSFSNKRVGVIEDLFTNESFANAMIIFLRTLSNSHQHSLDMDTTEASIYYITYVYSTQPCCYCYLTNEVWAQHVQFNCDDQWPYSIYVHLWWSVTLLHLVKQVISQSCIWDSKRPERTCNICLQQASLNSTRSRVPPQSERLQLS